MTTAKQKRAAVATAMRTALPTWTVYASPPTVPVVPSLVIAPGSPYREYATFTHEAVRLRLQIIVQPSPTAMDAIDDALDAVMAGLHSVTDMVKLSGSGVTVALSSGGDVLVATVETTVS